MSPTASAKPSTTGRIQASLEASPPARYDVSTAEPATVAGIERSMPPVRMQNV